MADDWFPQTGQQMYETILRDWLAGIMSGSGAFVASGLTVPSSSVNLNLSVAAGVAYIDGYRLEADAEVIALPASQTSYVYLVYAIDGFDNVTGHSLTSNTTGVTPAKGVLLCTAVTNGSAVTSTVDRRKVGFNVSQGYQPQAIVTQAVDMTSAVVTNIVNVTEAGLLHSIYFTDTGTGTARLKITVDGSTEFSEIVMQSGVLAGVIVFGNPLPLNLPHLVSLKIDVEVTSTGSGTLTAQVLRSTAV
jgi:hypothetical protein